VPAPPSTKPIVVILGPGNNFEGEVLPMLNYYKPLGYRVVLVENSSEVTASIVYQQFLLEQGYSSEDYLIVSKSFSSVNLFADTGQNCAAAVVSAWPGNNGYSSVGGFITTNTCSGGDFFVVSDLEGRYNTIRNTVSSENITFAGEVNPRCIASPTASNCPSGFSLNNIGFTSGFSGKNTNNYVIRGTKR
jgi:hypothetical protein